MSIHSVNGINPLDYPSPAPSNLMQAIQNGIQSLVSTMNVIQNNQTTNSVCINPTTIGSMFRPILAMLSNTTPVINPSIANIIPGATPTS